jgi:hypothetical protein
MSVALVPHVKRLLAAGGFGGLLTSALKLTNTRPFRNNRRCMVLWS